MTALLSGVEGPEVCPRDPDRENKARPFLPNVGASKVMVCEILGPLDPLVCFCHPQIYGVPDKEKGQQQGQLLRPCRPPPQGTGTALKIGAPSGGCQWAGEESTRVVTASALLPHQPELPFQQQNSAGPVIQRTRRWTCDLWFHPGGQVRPSGWEDTGLWGLL